MGRNKIFKTGKEEVAGYLHPEEYEIFEDIRWREKKGKTEIVRSAILEYIKNHGEGNDSFRLETWVKDPTFQAIPTYHSDKEKWIEHYKTSNPEERTRLRIQAMNFSKWFRMVDTNK